MIAKKEKKFGGPQPQDSKEFITEFLSILNEDLNKSLKKEYQELKEKGKDETELECAKRFWNLHLQRNDSIISDLFSGLLKYNVACIECGFNNITFYPLNILDLAIPSQSYVREKLSTHIKKKYSIDLDSKIALYAPTYRDDYKIEHYDMDYKKLRESLEKRFGGKWTILIRFHYKVFRELDTDKLTKNAVNVSDYPDMQEILSITDVGITDYSSWMCDYVLTRKPGFIYASDLDEYDNERGFYYSLHTTPFKVCENTSELCKAIEKFDDKVYQKGVDKFLKDRGCYEKGTACESIIKLIEESK